MLISVFGSKKRKGKKNADANEDFADVIRQKSILRRHFFADVKKSEFQSLIEHLESQSSTKETQLKMIWIERCVFQVLWRMKSLRSDKNFWMVITHSGLSIVS